MKTNISFPGEGMRKPVYLAVLGFSIVVAASSLGVTLTRYLGLRLYSPRDAAQAATTVAGPDVPAARPEEWNNIFAPADGMKMASRLPSTNVGTSSQAARASFVLVGTIVSSSPSARRAVLWANGMKEPKAFREKEEIEPGAFLASVERDKVWISRGNDLEKLEILPVGSRGRPAPAATAARPVAPPVAAAATSPAFATDPSTLSGIAPASRPSPDRAQSVGTPTTSSEDEEGDPVARARRKRTEGLRR